MSAETGASVAAQEGADRAQIRMLVNSQTNGRN